MCWPGVKLREARDLGKGMVMEMRVVEGRSFIVALAGDWSMLRWMMRRMYMAPASRM